MLSEITFPAFRDEHSGEYKCTASNKFGIDHGIVRLSVIGEFALPVHSSMNLVGMSHFGSSLISKTVNLA
jgi:hypothetical protein